MNIKEAQSLIKSQYFERDRNRGLYATFTWFVEEVGELANALLDMQRDSLEEEFADVFAWLLSLANLVNIDLENAFKKKYVNGNV
ncbi:MAG: MazG nucleotide pyrophosphohydrolase domain-containing protein [Desulfurococcaceae archaeon]